MLQAFVMPNEDEEKPYRIEFLYRDGPLKRETDAQREIDDSKDVIKALIRNRYKYPENVEIKWDENP